METIELYDENGDVVVFDLIDTFGLNEIDYAVVIPHDENETEYYIFKIEYVEEEVQLVVIEDDDEFNEVVEVYEDLKKEKLQ